jgi:hypothetical protein
MRRAGGVARPIDALQPWHIFFSHVNENADSIGVD